MLIDNIHLPKIIDGLAKFDGRKKRYVPYPSELKDDSSKKYDLQLLADLQTEWESLQKSYAGNIRLTQSIDKYYEHYEQVLWPDSSHLFGYIEPCKFC